MEIILDGRVAIVNIDDEEAFKTLAGQTPEVMKVLGDRPTAFAFSELQYRSNQPVLKRLLRNANLPGVTAGLEHLRPDGAVLLRLKGDRKQAFTSMQGEHRFTCPRCGSNYFSTTRLMGNVLKRPEHADRDSGLQHEDFGYCSQRFYVLEDGQMLKATADNYDLVSELTEKTTQKVWCLTSCGYTWVRSHQPSEEIAIYEYTRGEWEKYISSICS